MRFWLMAFVGLAFAAPDAFASSREVRERISSVEKHFDQLELAKACHYSAAMENSRPIDSEVDLKVAFQLKR
jgi:hypothetical protein